MKSFLFRANFLDLDVAGLFELGLSGWPRLLPAAYRLLATQTRFCDLPIYSMSINAKNVKVDVIFLYQIVVKNKNKNTV